MKVSIYLAFYPNQDRTFYWLHTVADNNNSYYGNGKAEACVIPASVMHNEAFAMFHGKLNKPIEDIKVIPSNSFEGNCTFIINYMEVLNFTV